MATVTFQNNNNSTASDPWTSASFSPAVNDLIVIVGNTVGGAGYVAQTCVESAGGGTYTQVFATGRFFMWIANQLAAATTARTITVDGTTSETGGGFSVYTIGGMTRTGLGAVRNQVRQTFSAGGTPTVVMGSAVDTNNPVLGCCVNSDNPATITQPASWTEDADNGFITPTSGGEWCSRASGETGSTITWGSTSVSSGEAYVLEIDVSIPILFIPSPMLVVPLIPGSPL